MSPFFRAFRFAALVFTLWSPMFPGGILLHAQTTLDVKPETPKTKDPEPKTAEPKVKEPESKPKEPEPTTRELEHKLKELEQKVKELEPKTKEADTKAKEPDIKAKEPDQKVKEQEQKAKEPDAKPKETEAHPKETEGKPKEAESKPKEGTKAKEQEAKPKEAEPKPKEAEVKPKEPEVAGSPCPQVHPPVDKSAGNGQPPADRPPADKPKPAEAEGKKPMRSPMVTAKLALMGDSRLFPYDIEIDTKDKDLVLLGKVASDDEKRAAADIVRCLDGVHAVENRLKVEPDASHGLIVERDKIITTLVKERFEKSKTLQAVKFEVKTDDGIVTLAGSTRFQVIILEAAQAARQVPGVKAVNTDAVRLVAAE